MIVVADAGPLRYLILLGKAELLPTLFAELVISEAIDELLRHGFRLSNQLAREILASLSDQPPEAE